MLICQFCFGVLEYNVVYASENLRKLVEEQYLQKNPKRDDWCDCLYENHVLWVVAKTDEFCKKFNADPLIAVAAALIHDIADSVMQREDEGHEEKSLEIGKELCEQAGYSANEVAIIIDDIALKHSCHDGVFPESEEGKLMAAADACSHYMTDFYLHAFNNGSGFGDYEWIVEWARKKIEKDYSNKIFHEEIRQKLKPYYEAWKLVLKS